jgi:hypothetical protein
MSEHALLAPSDSKRWLTCPGAVGLEKRAGIKDKPTESSAEGTVAHDIAYRCIISEQNPKEYLGSSFNQDGFEIEVDQEMVDAIEVYLDYIKGLKGVEAWAEEKVFMSEYVNECSGTIDYFTIVQEDDEYILFIVDFKYGKGILVKAYENPQGMLYSLGALSREELIKYRITKVVIVIVQPRKDSITEFPISINNLRNWGRNHVKSLAEKAYYLAKNPNEITEDDLNPSESGCRWCNVDCIKRTQIGYESAIKGFSDLTSEAKNEVVTSKIEKKNVRDPLIMSGKVLACAYKNLKFFLSWASKLETEISERLLDGQDVPGLKLVATEGNRSWTTKDEKILAKHLHTAGLKKEHYEKISIISPTQAEKKLKEIKPDDYAKRYQKLATALIHRPEGKPKVVSVDDKRPSIVNTVEEFDNIEKKKDFSFLD